MAHGGEHRLLRVLVPEPPEAPHPRLDGDVRRASRWFAAGVWVVSFVAFLIPAFGRQTFNTKLGVTLDPAGFFQRLWHLWDPLQSFGSLQDQYIGYGFPMGPFFLVGRSLGIPPWLLERAWMALLVTVAFWGIVRLAESLRVGRHWTRLVAGAAFALWPTYTILIGSTSGALLPGLLAPWALIPLVKGSKGGSTARAAALSGLAVLAMGGINAAFTLTGLLLPGLFLLTRAPSARKRSLLKWWVLAMVLATAWWALPFALFAHYGFNFLPYIEEAHTTTQTMSATEVLRGAGYWTAYLDFGVPWLQAGSSMTTMWAPVISSSVLAAGGLGGLARRDLPERKFLIVTLAVGAVGTLAGYPGPLGGPAHGLVQWALDGPLAPFRNVYKFEPMMAVALVLGVAHLLGAVDFGSRSSRAGSRARVGIAPRLGMAAIIAAVLAGVAAPYLNGRVLQSGSFAAIPSYWYRAAAFLSSHEGNARTLVVPADSHGLYTWGSPIDEPLDVILGSAWAQRDLVPFGGAGNQTLVSAIERTFDTGSYSPGLSSVLERSGVRYVLVRNDLDPSQLDSVAPQQVHLTLSSSGFRKVAGFGPMVTGGRGSANPGPAGALVPRYQAVEIFEPGDASRGAARVGPISAYPVSSTMVFSGGSDSLLQLADSGVLNGRAAILSGQQPGFTTGGHAQVVTDGNRRADNEFGLVRDNQSFTYTQSETNPVDAADGSGGKAPRQILAVPGADSQTVATLRGAKSISASSYGSWLYSAPQYDPYYAFDGDPSTAWVDGSATSHTGQWVQIDFDGKRDAAGSTVQLLAGNTLRPVATSLRVTTEAGSVLDDVRPNGSVQPLRTPRGSTSWMRVTFARLQGGEPGGPGAGIRGIRIPGVKVTRTLVPPKVITGPGDPQDSAPTGYSFDTRATNPVSLTAASPESRLDRTFSVPAAENVELSATAQASPGSSLDALVTKLGISPPQGIRASASSTWDSLAQFRASNLVDGDPSTAWIAGSPNAVVHLAWGSPRVLDQLDVVPAYGISAAPQEVRIASPAGTRTADVPANGVVRFAPLETDRVDVSFPRVQQVTDYNPLAGKKTRLPVGLAELQFPALSDLVVSHATDSAPFTIGCGSGPSLTLDGHPYATSLSGRVSDLFDFQPLRVTLCSTPSVFLSRGQHQLSDSSAATSTSPFAVNTVTLVPTAPAFSPSPPAAPRSLTVTKWQAESRAVHIGPGASSFVAVHENYNPGWAAELNGRALQAVQLDGWQQGFVVPAGQGGSISLSYLPGNSYRLALLVGALAAVSLGLIALGLLGVRRRREPGLDLGPIPDRPATESLAVAATSVVVVAVAGGLLVVLVPVIAFVGAKWRRLRPAVAAGAMLVAGTLAAVSAGVLPNSRTGTFGPVAQAFAIFALAAVLTPPLRLARRDTPEIPPGDATTAPEPVRTRDRVWEEVGARARGGPGSSLEGRADQQVPGEGGSTEEPELVPARAGHANSTMLRVLGGLAATALLVGVSRLLRPPGRSR